MANNAPWGGIGGTWFRKCKVPAATILIMGTLSGLSWVNRYPAVSHRLAQGDVAHKSQYTRRI